MFVAHFDQRHNWCLACNSDTACRIGGWPVLNATGLCQAAPNQILFGEESCCVQGEEPFQLAEWTRMLCNGSEWRQQFDICGGMACLDWQEWIMPWNWTVQNNTLPPDEQNCTAPSKYLAIYAGEHFFWLLATFGVGWVRLKIARHEEENDRSVLRYFLLSVWTGLRFRQNKDEVLKEKIQPGDQFQPAFTDRLRWGFPVIMGVFLAGVQLSFNFWAAHLMKSAPGYEGIHLARLALLFCCRPRLSWLSCLLALVSKERLVKIFGFEADGDGLWAAKLVLSSVAVTSAVTEAIMQLLGSYFLGTTAHIGAERGFFIIHNLRPKRWGEDARHMYIGALCWAMLCVPLVAVWFFVALFYSTVYNAVADWRRGIFNFLRPKSNNLPELAKAPVNWLLDHVNPDETSSSSLSSSKSSVIEQPISNNLEDPVAIDPEDPFNQPTAYDGPGGYNEQPLAIPGRHSSRRSRYSQLSQYEQQPFALPPAASGSNRAASGGYAHSASTVQRRTPSGNQYNALSQNGDFDEIQFAEQPVAPLSRLHRTQESLPSRRDGSHSSLLAPHAQDAPPSSSGNGSSNNREDYKAALNLKWQHWESKIIFAGAFLGMLAYASQWAFWDGFVKASGDRFCPPSVLKVAGLWWGAAILYVGAPFMGY